MRSCESISLYTLKKRAYNVNKIVSEIQNILNVVN